MDEIKKYWWVGILILIFSSGVFAATKRRRKSYENQGGRSLLGMYRLSRKSKYGRRASIRNAFSAVRYRD